MANYVWARDGRILGADRVAGTDATEVAGLPGRAIQRYLDQGWISLKSVDSVNTQGADVVAPAAVATTAVTTADLAAAPLAYDTVYEGAQSALVNELKAKVNSLQADLVALRGTVAALEANLSGPGKALA